MNSLQHPKLDTLWLMKGVIGLHLTSYFMPSWLSMYFNERCAPCVPEDKWCDPYFFPPVSMDDDTDSDDTDEDDDEEDFEPKPIPIQPPQMKAAALINGIKAVNGPI